MSTTELSPAERFTRHRDYLRRIVHGKEEIMLGEACRELDRILRDRGYRADCSPREVSRNLRAFGFEKAGMSGSGYDREPLYRRVAAAVHS